MPLARVGPLERGGEEAPGRELCAFEARARQQDDELVTADPERAITASGAHGEQVPHLGEERVTSCVPELVVDSLEVVEVDEDQRQRRGLPPCLLDLPRELLL